MRINVVLLLLVGSFFLTPLEAALPNVEEQAIVVPAPSFSWKQGRAVASSSSLRGKPVLLLLAPSPQSAPFRHQLRELESRYTKLAAQGLLCAAAFTEEEGIIPSNIPFITLLHGPQVATAYHLPMRHFGLALLGPDGNLDCQSLHPLSGQRICDLMDASYMHQKALRSL